VYELSISAGHGLIELQQVAGKTAITQCQANSPLKLLTPKSPGSNAWIFTSTYGGGLVGGDSIELELRAGADTRCLLTTQASTKIYRSENLKCRQALHAKLESKAVLISIPDPIACFTGADFEQEQRFDLAGDASLLMLDWFTSGRKARGERWAFRRFASSTEMRVENETVFRDVLLLDPLDGPIDGAMRMGIVDCFATAVLLGPAMAGISKSLLEQVAAQPFRNVESVMFSASEMNGGAVLRIAGTELETVGRWLKRLVGSVKSVLGQDPWMRKM
jgi:urease accessory protein